MMKKTIWSFLLALCSLGTYAQTSIKFESLSFAQAKESALKQNKLIFLDGYTSWCAPCKWMESNVFVKPAVADFFNSHFVNTKFDCEKGEGIDLAKTYGINSFPTYLFLDGYGTLVYRTQSRMEAQEFLAEGQRAADPSYHIPVLQAAFAAGESNPTFLLRYIAVMTKVDSKLAQAAKSKLDAIADPSFLKSADGWAAIALLAQNPTDKYATFFLANKEYFQSIAPAEAFQAKELQLLKQAMYGYLRAEDKAAFYQSLAYFKNSTDKQLQLEGAMFEVEWIAAKESPKDFVRYTEQLRKGLLKDQDDKLSFIARRNANKYSGDKVDPKVLQQCYVLGKQAVKLNPNEYSNQGTLAEICILLKKKKEAVKAAEAALALAELETSKIVKIATALLSRAQSM